MVSRTMRLVGGLLCGLLVVGCTSRGGVDRPPTPSPEALTDHGEHFEEDVVEVADGVHVAVGFGIANSVLIEGDGGVTVVDTLESVAAAERVVERFRAITDAPVEALVYTHSHPDHIMGAAAFVDPDASVEVYAHETLMEAADKVAGALQPIITNRSMRMYGNLLPDPERTNVGIGPFVDVHQGTAVEMIRPTRTFDDRLEIEVAGVSMELIHAPGETDDQVVVWLPEQRILLAGDNFYRAFPNLYTIRGTSFRDPKVWADSLELMRDLGADHLVPGHGRPLSGAEDIARHLTDYRDAIRYVHDQTIRLMNAGLTPDQIAPRIELPPHLAASPYLQPFYGEPSWSARMVYGGELGWFDSNPTNLHPTPPDQRAARLVELIGEERLEEAIDEAAAAGDHQWVLELTDQLLAAHPGHDEAVEARVEALRALGEREVNPNARHHYLTAAAELDGEIDVPFRTVAPTEEMLRDVPLTVFFDAMAVALDGEAAWDVEQQVVFDFPDLDEVHTLTVRRGVTELTAGTVPDPDIHVRIESLAFKQLLLGDRGPVLTLLRDVRFEAGGRVGLARFLRLFDGDVDG